MQVALVFPADQVIVLEISTLKHSVARLVVRVPYSPLACHQVTGWCQLQINRVHCLGNRHVLITLGLASA